MRRILLVLAALTVATPAFAQTTAAKGSFGLGATFTTAPFVVGGTAVPPGLLILQPGLNGKYFVDDALAITGNLGIASTENVGTQFTIAAGAEYHFLQARSAFQPLIGGQFGIIHFSPSQGDSTTGIQLVLDGGGEYFIAKNFSVQLTEGIQFSTKPTSFALTTRVGVNLYF
jgi:hypothetical protein